jgi:hypothetical protein
MDRWTVEWIGGLLNGYVDSKSVADYVCGCVGRACRGKRMSKWLHRSLSKNKCKYKTLLYKSAENRRCWIA